MYQKLISKHFCINVVFQRHVVFVIFPNPPYIIFDVSYSNSNHIVEYRRTSIVYIIVTIVSIEWYFS